MTSSYEYVYQVILVDERCTKDFMTRFGIYASLEEAKFAVDYTFFDDHGCNLQEVYIEKIQVGSIPDPLKRQGIKVCYLDTHDNWQWYKDYAE
jgi:hypothetical protein